MDRTLSTKDAAKALGFGTTNLAYHVRRGHIPADRLPTGDYRFSLREVIDFAQSRAARKSINIS